MCAALEKDKSLKRLEVTNPADLRSTDVGVSGGWREGGVEEGG